MEEDQSPFKVELENLLSQAKTFIKKPMFIGLSVLFIVSLISTYYILFMWNTTSTINHTNPANFSLPPVSSPTPILSPTFTPTPAASVTPSAVMDPTSSWNTFINKIYRYSIKYPNDWTASYVNSSDPLIPNFVSINPATASAKINAITISYTTRTNAQLAAIYGSTSSGTLTIASQSATEYDQQDSDGNKSLSIILEEPTYAYIFYAMDQYKSLLLQMLSTLVLNP